MSGGKAGEIKTESVWGVDEEAATMEAQIASLDAGQLNNRTRILETNIKVMRSELSRLSHEVKAQQERIKDNSEKIKMNKQLPYLVANVIEILDLQPEQEEDGAAMDTDAKSTKAVVIKTSTRQTIFLPCSRPGGPGQDAEAGRPGGRQQGQLPHTGHAARQSTTAASRPWRWTRSPRRTTRTWAG